MKVTIPPLPERLSPVRHYAARYGYPAFLGLWAPLVLAGPRWHWSVWLVWPLWGVYALMMFADMSHTFAVCPTCVRHMPLNPQARADQWAPVFRVVHAVYGRAGVMVAVAVAVVTVALVMSPVYLSLWTLSWWVWVMWAVGVLVVFGLHMERATHKRYGQWCALCAERKKAATAVYQRRLAARKHIVMTHGMALPHRPLTQVCRALPGGLWWHLRIVWVVNRRDQVIGWLRRGAGYCARGRHREEVQPTMRVNGSSASLMWVCMDCHQVSRALTLAEFLERFPGGIPDFG